MILDWDQFEDARMVYLSRSWEKLWIGLKCFDWLIDWLIDWWVDWLDDWRGEWLLNPALQLLYIPLLTSKQAWTLNEVQVSYLGVLTLFHSTKIVETFNWGSLYPVLYGAKVTGYRLVSPWAKCCLTYYRHLF